MRAKLPPSVQRRIKRGLRTPDHWWWHSERLPDWAEELLTPESLQRTGYFNLPQVARLRKRVLSGQLEHCQELTGVLTTQIWHMEFIQNTSVM